MSHDRNLGRELLAHLLAPTDEQRRHFNWAIEVMDEREMQELLLHAFSLSGPLERSELLRATSEITGIRFQKPSRRLPATAAARATGRRSG